MSAALSAPPVPRAPWTAGVPARPRGATMDGVLIRLADEGVPLGAICRVTCRPADYVRERLLRAVREGELAAMPAPEWPDRPDAVGPIGDAEILAEIGPCISPLMRLFGLPEQQAILAAVLLVRGEAARPTLLRLIATKAAAKAKLLDVVACKLRQRLAAHGHRLETLFGRGYALPRQSREAILAEIAELRDHPRAPL